MTEALQNYISSQEKICLPFSLGKEFSLKLKGKSKESMKNREPQ